MEEEESAANTWREELIRYSDSEGHVCFYSNQSQLNLSQPDVYESLLNMLEQNTEFKDVEAIVEALEFYRLEALPLSWAVAVAVVYTLTAITSFLLNALTLLALFRGRRTELRKYLINLSISDLMMSLFSIPFTYLDYMLGSFQVQVQPTKQANQQSRLPVTLCVFVSIATMIVIGLNRYWAIVHPLRRAQPSLWWRPGLHKSFTIGWVWLLGVGVSLPEYLLNEAATFCYRRHRNSSVELHWTCSYNGPDNFHYEIFIFLCTFVLPLLLLTYLYAAIALKLWRRRMPGNVDAHRDSSALSARKKVVKMLSVIVVFFALHWLPIQAFILISTIAPRVRSTLQDTPAYYLYVGTYFVSHWISMAHSCLNPLILYSMNDDFRSDLRALLWPGTRCRARVSVRRSRVVCPVLVGAHHHHQVQVVAAAASKRSRYAGETRSVYHHDSTRSLSGLNGPGSAATGSTLAAVEAVGSSTVGGGAVAGNQLQLASALPEGAMCPGGGGGGVVISFVVGPAHREQGARCLPLITTMITSPGGAASEPARRQASAAKTLRAGRLLRAHHLGPLVKAARGRRS